MAHSAPTDRRRLLQLAAAGAGALWLPRSAWSQPRFSANPFALGVASGSPTHDSVVLWTRLLPQGSLQSLGTEPVTVRWEIAHDERFARIVQTGQSQALAQLAHSVHVEVAGLEPDRWYFYRFMVGDWASPTGRTRTFPAPEAMAQKLRLAYASCQRWEHGYYSAWRHMRDENVDAVMFLGDYMYEYPISGNPVRVHAGGGWAVNLDGYRERYALHKSDPDLQAMHAACPWVLTWDDHEVQNDYAGVTAGNNGPVVESFTSRRASAYQAYYEHMPVRASALTQAVAGLAAGAEFRLYSQQRFGRLAQLVLLDNRQYRDPHVCGRAGGGSGMVNPTDCQAWNDPGRTLLGAAQERWLDRAFSESGPGWTVLGQQTVFGQRDNLAGPGQTFWNDGWDGYGAARQRLTQSLQRHKVASPVLFGGDVHENWVGHVKADYARPDSPSVGVEFCGTSITSRSAGNARIAERLAENPHFVFADSDHRGYGVAEFTPGLLTTTLRVVDDATRKDAAIRTLARFAVEAGRPRVERA